MPFPKDFTWGAATASYQIEGATAEGGRGASIWDMFCRIPGKVYHGDSGEITSDHFHHVKEDVALMKKLGIQAYRLSLSWSRILPEGTGKVSEDGLGFYDNLIDELLKAGITPWVTLYHWDLPYALFLRGGWLNPSSSLWFEDYTRVAMDMFSDRVTHWFTINEPQVFLQHGLVDGNHAPGLQLDWPEALRATHNVLLAHGRAVRVIREHAKQKAMVGYAPVGSSYIPATESPADIEAARLVTLACFEKSLWTNTWFSDPMFFGAYPEDGLKIFGDAMPKIPSADMDIIKQPLDFYGFNTYFAARVRMGAELPEEAPFPLGSPHTMFHWQVTPQALYWTPKFLYERYKVPMYVTENGLGGMDWVSEDGKVHDPQRIDYTSRYLKQLRRAIDEGVDVRGYFHWSLMDNFEWAEGFRQRFGLVFVDYPTGQRIPKDSFDWYAKVTASNGESLGE